MTDRCRCTPYSQDAGGGYWEQLLEPSPLCPEHGDVDAILASGRYTDRKGRLWERTDSGEYTQWSVDDEWPWIEHGEMRLRIVRDLHRDECPGLVWCAVHPATVVIAGEREKWRRRAWKVRTAGTPRVAVFDSFGAALDAARHMTGATP